jgi:hypothetical protein
MVTDRILGQGTEDVTWRLHLAPVDVSIGEHSPGRVTLTARRGSPVTIVLESPAELAFAVERTAASDRYGNRFERPCLVLRGPTSLPAVITCTLRLGVA